MQLLHLTLQGIFPTPQVLSYKHLEQPLSLLGIAAPLVAWCSEWPSCPSLHHIPKALASERSEWAVALPSSQQFKVLPKARMALGSVVPKDLHHTSSLLAR